MRSIFAVVVGFGLLAFTSCSENQQKPQDSRVADNAPTMSQSESHGPSEVHFSDNVHGKHHKAEGHPGSYRKTGDDLENHGETHPEHLRDGDSIASGNDEQHQSDGSFQRRHGSHSHKNAAHGHSNENRKAGLITWRECQAKCDNCL